MKRGWRAAFTLIELLVVVAIIALLLSILLPSLAGAREQGKKAKCLANLNNLAKGIYQYATDDSAEQVIPIHRNMIRKGRPYWEHRTVNWFAWGGRSGQRTFMTSDGAGWFLDDTSPDPSGEALPDWAANKRPLNIYMLGDIGKGDAKKLEWFQCPSDTGYPDDPLIDDSPSTNAERSCYDTLGNSYRGSLACYTFGQSQSSSTGAFAVGVWGHRLTTLLDTGRLVMLGEPTWFNMIGQDQGNASEVKVYGWHKKKMMDNLAFCDGSARATKAEKAQQIDHTAMGVDPSAVSSIHRGTGFRLDVYPIGGARIFGNWSGYTSGGSADLWPWKNFQDNLHVDDTIDH
jgi:prepilin-type N-terminal cleavage/methylation domain-containing protein